MMSERRSARARKPVNYTTIANDFGDDDEDFASSHPPSKKSKIGKEGKVQEKQNSSEPIKPNKTVKEKKPLQEKLFQQDLELAIELSKSKDGPQEKPIIPTIEEMPKLEPVTTGLNIQKPVPRQDEDIPDLQIESTMECSSQAEESESDFSDAEEAKVSSDDDSTDDDSDVSFVSIKKNKKKSPVGRSNKPAAQQKATAKKSSKITPSSNNKKTNAVTNLPKKISEHRQLVLPTVKSPMSPGIARSTGNGSSLRLGLSRNVKVKPLHQKLAT